MLMILWSLENSQAVYYTVLSALLPYYSRDTGLRGNVCFASLSWREQFVEEGQLAVFSSSLFDQIAILLIIDKCIDK